MKVESLAKNPPIMELDFDAIYGRIEKLILKKEEYPTKQAMREHLGKLQSILEEREGIYRVLEWKDGSIYKGVSGIFRREWKISNILLRFLRRKAQIKGRH